MASVAAADIKVTEDDAIEFGSRKLLVRLTPGHTCVRIVLMLYHKSCLFLRSQSCMSLVLDDLSMVFTGDTLMVRGCGRTDFQDGNAELLYDNIYSKLFTLPNECLVYPAHDYNGFTHSTIFEEKTFNPRLIKSKDEFVIIMNNLNLPNPAMINEAVPANIRCGL